MTNDAPELNYLEATRVAKVIADRTRNESEYVSMKRALLIEALKEAYIAGFHEAEQIHRSKQKPSTL